MSSQSSSHRSGGSSAGYRRGNREGNGDYYQEWIDGVVADKECPVARCQLTYNDMVQGSSYRVDVPPSGEDILEPCAAIFNFTPAELGMPPKMYHQDVTVMQRCKENVVDSDGTDTSMGPLDDRLGFESSWSGTIANSIIALKFLRRIKEEPQWSHMSEITDAVYHHFYPHDKVRYIFVHYVVNPDTTAYLKDHLYTAYQGVSTLLVPPEETVKEWHYDTPEYQGILGTKIGKVVGSYVLGHYNPGTVRISSIRTALEPSEEVYLPKGRPEGHIAHFMFTLTHWDEDQHEYKLWEPESLKRKAEDESEGMLPPFKKYKGTPANKLSKKHLARPSKRTKTSRWPTSFIYRTLIHLFLIDLPAYLLVDRFILSGYAGNGGNLIEAGWEFFHAWMQRFDGWPDMADLNLDLFLKYLGLRSS